MGTIIRILLFLAILTGQAWATDWYVRSGCGNNGDGTGSTCGTGAGYAWNSFTNITWASIQPGDTLYVIGTFTPENLTVGKPGTAGNIITIRGNHVAGAGQIGNSGTDGRICVNSYTAYSYLTVYGTIGYCKGYIASTGFQFIASTNEVRDYDKGLISGGLTTDYVFIGRGTIANNRHVYGVASNPTDQGAYERLYVNTSAEGAMWSLTDEGPVAGEFYPWLKLTNVTVDHCTIFGALSGMIGYPPLNLGGVSNLTISNNEVDGRGFSEDGALYIVNDDSWIRPSNVLIENNYLHDIGSASNYVYDNHCIGLAAGNGVIIRGNHLKGCAAGIVIYPGASANQSLSGLEISRNLIEGMDYQFHPTQFPGCGIMFSGVDQCPLCDPALVAYNIITTPLNCPVTKTTYECVGIGSKWSVKNKFYNNILIANDYNFAFAAQTGIAVDLRNNISYNPNAYHIALYPTSPGSWTEDYNIYYPNAGTKFKVGNNSYNYADYIINHPAEISGDYILTSNPLFLGASNFHLQVGSPAIDNGVNYGQLFDFENNSVPQGAGFDIGAYEFVTSVSIKGIFGRGFILR